MDAASRVAVVVPSPTATLLAASILEEAAGHAARGVPVNRLVEGLKLAAASAAAELRRRSRPLTGTEDPRLRQVALVAARGDESLADLALQAAQALGSGGPPETEGPRRRRIVAREGAVSRLVTGLAVRREPLSTQMPGVQRDALVLVLDDALEADFAGPEALRTEAGLARHLQENEAFRRFLEALPARGVTCVACSRVASDLAEEVLGQAGVLVLERVPRQELLDLADHLGAQIVKRAALGREPSRLSAALGRCSHIHVDEPLGLTWFEGGRGRPAVTLLVGAATPEVLEERRRVAEDAAAAVEAALDGGVLPGGGATELALSRALAREGARLQGMTTYGVAALTEALKRPLAQMAANAGYNPLEKLGDVLSAQARADEEGREADALGLDLDSGEVSDLGQLGVWDPAPVKLHALAAAVETAIAILRIRLIVQKAGRPAHRGGDSADAPWQEGDPS